MFNKARNDLYTIVRIQPQKKLYNMITSKLSKYLLLLLIPLFSITMFTACSDDDDSPVQPDPDPEPTTLVDVAAGDDRFSTLVGIVQDLGLEETLATTELTVFAPTNAAFEKISEVIPDLTNEDLEQIVTYHLIAGTVLSGDLDAQQDVEMLQGEVTLVQSSAAGVLINGFANVVEADLEADNGVIHAIDEVLLPTEQRVALQGPSLVEVAENSGNFETLVGLAEDTGFTTTLQFLGPFTAFAPTDEAFNNLFEVVDPATLTPQQIGFILSYHVLNGEVLSTDLQAQQTVPTAAEEPLYITSGDDGVAVNGTANVTTADLTDPTNGVIHVVDQVLLPNAFNTVAGVVSKNYDLATLLSVVAERPAILDVLNDAASSLTVFAPDNAAFTAALEAFPGLTADQLTDILTYHVLAAKVLSTDLEAAQTVETLTGESIYVTAEEGTVTINNSATVSTADLEGNNGAVHVIDGVLLPNEFQNIVQIASKNYNLSTLVSLVADAGLVPTLEGDGPFTVFAPTNAAFEAVSETLATLSEEQVAEVLTYHVAALEALSGDLSDGMTVPTVQGEEITVNIDAEGNVTLNGSVNVETVDLQGTNGVIHIIDGVLLPPSF
jgi:transforming growth factor-beta-induced protein